MYVAWALQSGLAGGLHTDELPENLTKLAERSLTPGAFFLWACDGKFTNEDLSDEGIGARVDFESQCRRGRARAQGGGASARPLGESAVFA